MAREEATGNSKYICPICGADSLCTEFTDGMKWGRSYCNSCDCCGPEVRTGYDESIDAPWRTEARKQFADVANEYAINQFADDTNVDRSLWVKTSDRLPTREDGLKVVAVKRGSCTFDGKIDWDRQLMWWDYVKLDSSIKYWMPIPPLPEEEKK